MNKKNVLFLIIDALRYDVVANEADRAVLMPNLGKLFDGGFFSRVVANSATTQFVLPALLSQTYPLDYGGYDSGIRKRPQSFVELLKKAGYFTHLATSCNQYGLTHDYDRGFDSVRGLYSASGQIRRLILRKLDYEISLWKSGEKSQNEVIEVVREELGLLLRKLKSQEVAGPRLPINWRQAEWHNKRISDRCQMEIELLEANPMAVIDKISEMTAANYWAALGDAPSKLHQNLVRFSSIFLWAIELVVYRFGTNIPKFGAYQFPVELVVSGLPDTLKNRRPWFVLIHVMDVHSFFFFRGIVDILRKLRHLPRLLMARRRGLCRRPLLHDLSLMQIDYKLKQILNALKSQNPAEDPIVVIIGDHGKHFPGIDARPPSDVHQRTYREHIDTVFMMSGTGKLPDPIDGLLDSMSVSSTLLEALDISPHASFKGTSAYDGGRKYVISENAGRGSADLERKDMFFTITSKTHKLMTGLFGDQLLPIALFDLTIDPNERTDVKAEKQYQDVIEAMLKEIVRERAEVLNLRMNIPPDNTVTG
tara:strand:- start:1067 stop:2674 length:1608 start_codon:yes stop_codon:yes gene_type:complete